MRGEGERGSGGEHDGALRRREGLFSIPLAAMGRALEAEQDRWFLWLPVLFASGIITYFNLYDEPSGRVAIALLLGATGLCLVARHAAFVFLLGGAALALAAGFAAAKLRTEIVRAPVLTQELRYAKLTGLVETHELRDKGRARLTLRVLALDNLPPEQRPYRARVTMPAKQAAGVRIGDAVAFSATLQSPPEPIAPGSVDFARQAWFDRVGASGYATSGVVPVPNVPGLPWDLALWSRIDALRAAVNARIGAVLPGETGAIATALVTGDRGGISQGVTEAMRDSGLAHILSISGLHMAIIAGTVFWLVRTLLPSCLRSRCATPSRNGRLPLRWARRVSTWPFQALPCRQCAPGS